METQCLPLVSVAKGFSLLRGKKNLKCFKIVWLSIQKTEDLGHQPFLVSSQGTLHAFSLIVKNITMNISKLSGSVELSEYLLQSNQMGNLENSNLEILLLVSPSLWTQYLSTYLEIFIFLPMKEVYSVVSFFWTPKNPLKAQKLDVFCRQS